MQFPESWLREFCNPPISTAELADTLTMAGMEVEELRAVAPPFTQVVVGEIKEAVQHPNADRLRVCQVDVGQGALLNIVCGAPNARVGIRVPCALVGAELPPGDDGQPFRIKLGKLRGVESQGMLCSARELKLSEDHGGLLELAADAPLGQDIRQHLRLDDTVFTLKLTPNLAHGLSVHGIAREVSALTGAPLKVVNFPAAPVTADQRLPVRIEAPDLCGRFSGRVVRGVDTRVSTPAWMVERLARCGQRSVSPLVDISNYVMFEFGRPTHIFDLDKIQGGLVVRWARQGEQLKLLNGNTVALDPTVGVIADEQAVESLAGIMGGDATAVSESTRNIYIEAAFWHPRAVAGRSRRFNFATDAGHRFERGVDPALTVEHIEHITRLVQSVCGGDAGPMDDQAVSVPVNAPVSLRVARASKVIGMPLTQAQCADALRRLGLPVTEGDGVLTVQPPSSRFDLQIEEDLIEEVARMVGFAQLPVSKPLAPIAPQIRPEARRGAFAVRRLLAGRGYQETINNSFVEEHWETELAGNAAPIRLLNPIASHLAVMRSSLIGSLLQVAKFNLDRKTASGRVFEIGRVFLRDASVSNSDTTVEGFAQPPRAAGLAWGLADRQQWGLAARPVDFFDVKGDVEALLAPRAVVFEPISTHPALHPGRAARVLVEGQPIGVVGELHPRWRQRWALSSAPVVFELDMVAVMERQVPVASAVARHQAVDRDLALIVPEATTHAALMQAIHAAQAPWLADAWLFDVYRPQAARGAKGGDAAATWLGEHEKSLAVTLRFQAEASLTDAQVDQSVATVLAELQQRLGARLRA